MKKFAAIAFSALVILSLYYCNPTSREENLTPVLDSISPTSKVSHLPAFTLTVSGYNFNTGSIIVFNGIEKTTAYISSTELACRVDPDDITLNRSMGLPGDTISSASSQVVSVLVRNPSPAGDSNPLDFTITENPTFIDPVNITNHSRGYIMDFDIEADDTGNLYVSYLSDQRDSWRFDIFLKKSADKGTNWSPAIEVPGSSTAFRTQDIALNPAGNILVEWTSYGTPPGIYLQRSTNGITWKDAVEVYDVQSFSVGKSCITADQAGNLYVVFEEYTGLEVALKTTCSTDNGLNWSPPIELFNEYIISARFPQDLSPSLFADHKGSVYAFWHSISSSGYAIYFSRSDNNGVTWGQPKEIFRSVSVPPNYIAVDQEGNINWFWSEVPLESDTQMYLRRFTDKGDTPGDIINLHPSWEIKQKQSRGIMVDSAGNINILFTAETPGEAISLLSSRSTDNGQTWSQPVEIPFHNAIEELKMAVDNAGNIYIAIYSYGMDAEDIYFSKNIE